MTDLAAALAAIDYPARPALPAHKVQLLPQRATAPTREAWLNTLVDLLRPVFLARAGIELPRNIRVSCSWASSGRGRAVGECWDPRASADGTWEVMISYSHLTPFESADTLVHELVHVAVGIEAGHGPLFRACAEAIGLRGPMRSTPEMTPALRRCLHDLCQRAGGYPGAPLGVGRNKKGNPTGGLVGLSGHYSSAPAPQSNRQLLIVCNRCGVKLRGARGIGNGGGGIRSLLPTPASVFACPCGGRFRPERPLAVWPEINYLLAVLALAGVPGLKWIGLKVGQVKG